MNNYQKIIVIVKTDKWGGNVIMVSMPCNQLRLSVGVVVYRNYDSVIKAIESLEQYLNPKIDTRVFIIDNSNECSDKHELFVNTIKRHSKISYHNTNDNLGFGKGHNYVIDIISSKYHCIMNPDIIFVEDVFTPLLTYLESHEDVGMVIPKITDEKGNIQAVYRTELTVFDLFIRLCRGMLFNKRRKKHTLQHMDYTKPFCVPFGQGSFLIIRTELFKDLGGFDENYFMYVEDADLCKRVNNKSKLMYVPYAKVIHKWERQSHKNIRLFFIHLKSLCYYFRKWGIKVF